MSIRERLIALVASETGHTVGPDTPVESVTKDSLEFVSLMQAVCEQFWEMPMERWSRIDTVADLERELLDAKP